MYATDTPYQSIIACESRVVLTSNDDDAKNERQDWATWEQPSFVRQFTKISTLCNEGTAEAIVRYCDTNPCDETAKNQRY